jgi:lipid-A-disaccharide synthase
MIESKTTAARFPELFQVMCGSPHRIFEQADMLIAASGTITLEAALCCIPTVIVYKMSPVTFQVGRALVKVKHAGLANIIMDREVMPELLQDAATPENISAAACRMLDHLDEYRQTLRPVRRLLGEPGAAARAAGIALALPHKNKNPQKR